MKKINKIQILRFIIQIGFLILLPGLFTLAFSELKTIYLMFMNGNFNFVKDFPNLIEAITILPITILFGRFFCGWICAFGTFNDILFMISKKVLKIKFKINPKVDAVLKYLKYGILLFIVYFLWTVGIKSFDNASPWDAFAQIPQFSQAISEYTVAFVILGFIIVGAIFIERFFCRYLCPLGGIFAIINKFSIFKIDKPTEKCGKCRMCTNNCPMGIELYKTEKSNSGECIGCLKCTEVCPRKNAKSSLSDKRINSTIVSAVVIGIFVGSYYLNNIIGGFINSKQPKEKELTNSNSTKSDSTTTSGNVTKSDSTTAKSESGKSDSVTSKSNVTSAETTKTSIYKDGIYEGVGQGYRPGLTVLVEIKSDKITNVQITSINDTPRYYAQPINKIPSEVIKAQSYTVDAISGATRTSNGIMMAVKDALTKAKV